MCCRLRRRRAGRAGTGSCSNLGTDWIRHNAGLARPPVRLHLLTVAASSRNYSLLGRRLCIAALWIAAACSGDGDPTGPVSPPPPPPPPPPPVLGNDPPTLAREFRGLWVATVANIDWPTQPGLSQNAAFDEMRTILDRAQSLRMNAVIVQVRAAGDAIYPSTKEPWSRVLTGTQGVAPGWDPLAAWIEEAHRRGLELHAWFNPFRA